MRSCRAASASRSPASRLKVSEKASCSCRGPNIFAGYWQKPDETASASATVGSTPAIRSRSMRAATSRSSVASRNCSCRSRATTSRPSRSSRSSSRRVRWRRQCMVVGHGRPFLVAICSPGVPTTPSRARARADQRRAARTTGGSVAPIFVRRAVHRRERAAHRESEAAAQGDRVALREGIDASDREGRAAAGSWRPRCVIVSSGRRRTSGPSLTVSASSSSVARRQRDRHGRARAGSSASSTQLEHERPRALIVHSGLPRRLLRRAPICASCTRRSRAARRRRSSSRAARTSSTASTRVMDRSTRCRSRPSARSTASCFGGGFELALTCDVLVAETRPRAFAFPELRLGIMPGLRRHPATRARRVGNARDPRSALHRAQHQREEGVAARARQPDGRARRGARAARARSRRRRRASSRDALATPSAS